MGTVSNSGGEDVEGDIFMYDWPVMGNDDSGVPLKIAGQSERTLTATGSFGGATLVFEGSNDDTVYFTLKAADGTSLSMTQDSIFLILENPRFIRPTTSGGTGTAIKVMICAKAVD